MSVLTTADARRAIYGDSTYSPTTDEASTLAEIVAAVDVEIERVAGAGALPTAVKTWTGRARSGPIVLPWRYASVASVTLDGVTLSASTYDDETRASMGILDGVNGAVPWASGTRVVVTANVGQVVTPADVQRAAFLLARHWGQLDRQGGRGAWADENGAPLDSAIPRSVRDLLAGQQLAGLG